MLSACLPLKDSGLSGLFKRQRVHLHLHFKPFQKNNIQMGSCFNPSVENSICPGSFGIRSRSTCAGMGVNEVDSSPLAPLRVLSLPALSQKISPGWLSVKHLRRAPKIHIRCGYALFNQADLLRSYLNQNVTADSSCIPPGPIFCFQLRRKPIYLANLIN